MKSALFACLAVPFLSFGCSESTLPVAGGNSGGVGTVAGNGSQASGGAPIGVGGTGQGSNARGGVSQTSSNTDPLAVGGSTTTIAGGGTPSLSGGSMSNSGGTTLGGTTLGGTSNNGGTSSQVGGASNLGGSSSSAGHVGTSGASGAAVVYELPPPDRCHDQDYIPYDYTAKTGCKSGDATTDCGGKCQVINACSETSTAKPYADTTFMCPRNLLFSSAMEQAAADDGNLGFHYAVVGHDVDPGGVDGNAQSACCQCYQLVYAYPSPFNDRQGQLNPDNPNPPASAIPVPPPLIVQSFNTAATPTTFDVYMPAGGLGANNACAPVAGSTSASGQYMYTSYPDDGQPSQGGVKPASLYAECRTKDKNWLTTASLSEPACTQRIADACNEIASNIPGLTEQARSACIRANSLETFYHLNWSVYVMKVECPEHLTRVTGCRLAPQGLPTVKKNVRTAAEAALDSQFWAKTSSSKNLYETTTMEDCCRPSCAAINWISGKGLTADAQYRAFYTCNGNGVPYTQ